MTPRTIPRLFLILAAALLLAAPAGAGEPAKPIWLLVTRPMFADSLRPLVQHRQQDGFEAVVSRQPVAEAIKSQPRRPAFVLLVGDDEEGRQAEPWYLPARRANAYCWHGTQPDQFPTDAAYGDIDGDGVPDIPVGRIPARTAEQASTAAAKTIAYERREARLSDLRFPLWAGSPAYTPLVDSAATMVLVRMIPELAPPWVQPWIVTGSPTHPLCGYPADQPRLFTEQLGAGGAMAALIGHGASDSFFSMSCPLGVVEYTARQASCLLAGDAAPPLLIVACYCGAFAGRQDCLAESLLWLPGGPVAVVAASSESHPLPNYYTGVSLVKELSQGHRRLGELWLASQRNAIGMRNIMLEKLLRDAESELEGPVDVAKLQRDQLLLYGIFGDPAIVLRLPEKLSAKAEFRDGVWQWNAAKPPGAAELHVEIRPDGLAMPPIGEQLVPDKARQRLKDANAVYEFQPVVTVPADKEWAGQFRRPGLLRLTALAGRRLYVATFLPPAPSRGQ